MKRNKQYLVLIPTLAVLFYLIQNEMGLSDLAAGIITGTGFGLAVLAIIAAKKGATSSNNLQENINRKILNN